MTHTVILNFFIVAAVFLMGLHTNNPLMILGLFFLQELPVHVVTNEQQIRAAGVEKYLADSDDGDDDGDDKEPAIGFTAKV